MRNKPRSRCHLPVCLATAMTPVQPTRSTIHPKWPRTMHDSRGDTSCISRGCFACMPHFTILRCSFYRYIPIGPSRRGERHHLLTRLGRHLQPLQVRWLPTRDKKVWVAQLPFLPSCHVVFLHKMGFLPFSRSGLSGLCCMGVSGVPLVLCIGFFDTTSMAVDERTLWFVRHVLVFVFIFVSVMFPTLLFSRSHK